MKHPASLVLAATLCACTRAPDDAAGAGAAAAPSTVAPAPATAPPATAASVPGKAGATVPAQGVAVGEPNPAAPGGFQDPAAGQAPGSGLARFDGYGDMRFGMDVAQARAAWGGELNGQVQGAACTYLNPVGNKTPSYFAFMFEGGRFVRYDVGNDLEIAPGGGRRGMGTDEIRRRYAGRITESPHKYVKGGRYLKVQGDGGALVFETDAAGKVTEWHAGLEPQVDYIEGCS